MRLDFSGLIRKYGRRAEICPSAGGSIQTYVVMQPLLTDRTHSKWESETKLGRLDLSRYSCYGIASDLPDDLEDAYLIIGGKKYDIVRAEKYRIGEAETHWEAIVSVREEEYDG